MRFRWMKCCIIVMIVIAVVAIPSGLAYWWHTRLTRLGQYQAFIHEHYVAEIQQIESAVLQWPEDTVQDEEAYLKMEATRAKLTETFSVGDFYAAHWSFDSHHGMQGTGLPEGGYGRDPVFSVTDESRQSLHYGKSFTGVPLLIFEKWIPNSPVMRHIQIAFRREAVDSRMNSN